MIIDERIGEELLAHHQRLLASGKLLPVEKIDRYLDAFRERFAPEVLLGLDGKLLLRTMHENSDHDSLVYWLEYKNDEEFPSPNFGGIAGGSALKYGIYRRKDTGLWMTGAPSNQRSISEEEAIQAARSHRDQFVAGAEVLERFSTIPFNERHYQDLQTELERAAPDVQGSSWGHKYFSLLFPGVLDDYHNAEHQRFHLIKILLEPPPGEGRYLCAGHYIQASEELDLPPNHFTSVLNDRDGAPHSYWRVGTSYGKERRTGWPAMLADNFVGIGWDELGELGWVTYDMKGKEALRALVKKHFPSTPQQEGKDTAQLFKFVAGGVEPGDLVMAMDGATVLGVGQVKGDYYHASGETFSHRREVEWLTTEEWKTPEHEGLRTTFCQMKKPVNLVATEARVMAAIKIPQPPPPPQPHKKKPARLSGTPGAIQEALQRKGQVILYGPPGTGKTHWAMATVKELMARAVFGCRHEDLTDDQQGSISVSMCTFHPAYGYEDFLEGYRPSDQDGKLHFKLRDGIFKALCGRAAKDPRPHYLIIDEINRGDIPRIFGELLTILEKSKRGIQITLPLSGQPFSVPENVHVVGTMNTADRSIALLDTALRRRFAFIELMPDSSVLGDATVAGIPLGPWLDALNTRVRRHLGADGRNLQVGHSYLMHDGHALSSFAQLVAALRDEIVPLLQEYCYEDFQALRQIIGKDLVDLEQQEIHAHLFDLRKRDQLVQALLAPCPEVTATDQAAAAEAQIQLDLEVEQGDDPAEEGSE